MMPTPFILNDAVVNQTTYKTITTNRLEPQVIPIVNQKKQQSIIKVDSLSNNNYPEIC
jgi:hypothetical protein